jgi:hypothetical protein
LSTVPPTSTATRRFGCRQSLNSGEGVVAQPDKNADTIAPPMINFFMVPPLMDYADGS